MVYVVMGETGEYSDRHDWPVYAFDNKEAAEAYVASAETWLRENNVSYRSELPDYEMREALINPYDPRFKCDYTGVRYCVMPVEVR